MQGEGDHPAPAEERQRNGGGRSAAEGCTERSAAQWRKPGETPCARVEAGLLGVFDLKAAQRRMHLDLRGAAGCPRWEGEPEDDAGAFPASAGAGEGRSSSP